MKVAQEDKQVIVSWMLPNGHGRWETYLVSMGRTDFLEALYREQRAQSRDREARQTRGRINQIKSIG